MSELKRHVLLAGVSTRALAQSAAQAGYQVTALDAFGDRDLRAIAEVLLVPPASERRPSPMQVAAIAARVPASFVAYTSNFENYPAAVERLARGRILLGNPPEVLRRVRNPFQLQRVLRRHGLAAPATRTDPPPNAARSRPWLLKPRSSGGGHGIRRWRPGSAVPRGTYLQERVSGIPGSIIFAGTGSSARLLGLTRQLVGEAAFGAREYRYCGSLLAGAGSHIFPRQMELLDQAGRLADVLCAEFGLVGLNGADFIARDGALLVLEVNPRFSASMELIERGSGLSMFQAHAAACGGVLPEPAGVPKKVFGKAIVFARRTVRIDSRVWPPGGWLADLPDPGEEILESRPICTVLAHAENATRCHQLLVRQAAAVYRGTRPSLSRAS